jgi:hypothetical protein
MTGYTCDLSIYLGKDRQNTTQTMMITHAKMRSLIRRVEQVGLYFSSADLFDDVHTRAIICCGTVRQSHKGMPWKFDSKTLKLKTGDMHARVRGVLTAVI